MDLIGGLGAAKLALDLAKDLREIDRSVDEAGFKLKLAELTAALADTKVALGEAKLVLGEKSAAIDSLQLEIAKLKSGEICPKCRDGRMTLIETKPSTTIWLRRMGVEDWRFRCGEASCGFVQIRKHDPHGVMRKYAARST